MISINGGADKLSAGRAGSVALNFAASLCNQVVHSHYLLSETMPGWKDVFSGSEVRALISCLRFLGGSKHGLMGDPEIGMRLYQKYCQDCHGESGDGDGIMTKLMGIMPMDHTNPNSLDNDELVKSILDGKGRFMPAWRGILSQSDVEALVSYIRLLLQ